MSLKCKLFAFVFFVASISSANRIGNGGNVVACTNTIQILDFYESKNVMKYIGEKKSKDYKSITQDVFKRLSTVSKKLSAQYIDRLETIHEEIDFLENVALSNVQDSLHVFKPADKDCDVKQIAIRKEVTLPSEKKFVFDKKLWDRLDEQNKSALIVHEIIYEHFNKLGETTSPKVRKVVGYLYQEQINSKDFWNIIKSLKLPIYPD